MILALGLFWLVQQNKDNKIESTVGIESSTMNFGNGDVTVYDFAGQLEYTVTHQFFMSNEVSKHPYLSSINSRRVTIQHY
jgi:hypothetical protein